MKAFHVLLMPGEGIGLEIVTAGEKVLRAAASMFDLKIDITIHTVGLPMFEQIGQYMSEETVRLCEDLKTRSNAAILFGAVADEPLGILRKKYDFFLNLRPIRLFSGINTSPLKVDRIQRVDMLIVRELVSGIYYGTARQGKDDTGQWAGQEMFYHESEIRRITLRAFELARQRRKRLHMVQKEM